MVGVVVSSGGGRRHEWAIEGSGGEISQDSATEKCALPALSS